MQGPVLPILGSIFLFASILGIAVKVWQPTAGQFPQLMLDPQTFSPPKVDLAPTQGFVLTSTP